MFTFFAILLGNEIAWNFVDAMESPENGNGSENESSSEANDVASSRADDGSHPSVHKSPSSHKESASHQINAILEVWNLECDNDGYDPLPTLTG